MLLLLLCNAISLSAQHIALPEALQLLNASPRQMHQVLGRKGYQQQEFRSTDIIYYAANDSLGFYTIKKMQHPYGAMLVLCTSVTTTEAQWHNSLHAAGFVLLTYNDNGKRYAKANLTVTVQGSAQPEGIIVTVENRHLPRRKDIRYAEDLLAFNSHQQLEHVFGTGNVVHDSFVHNDGGEEPCSVLYPNTPLEAVFLWKDAMNGYGLQQLRVGGNRHTKKAREQSATIAQSNWMSRQGVYPGMRLLQLERHHGQLLSICPGNTVCAHSGGFIDFTQLGLELSCIYCPDDATETTHFAAAPTNLHNSMFVATLILRPSNTSPAY